MMGFIMGMTIAPFVDSDGDYWRPVADYPDFLDARDTLTIRNGSNPYSNFAAQFLHTGVLILSSILSVLSFTASCLCD